MAAKRAALALVPPATAPTPTAPSFTPGPDDEKWLTRHYARCAECKAVGVDPDEGPYCFWYVWVSAHNKPDPEFVRKAAEAGRKWMVEQARKRREARKRRLQVSGSKAKDPKRTFGR